MKTTGEKIRDRRIELGMTQEELGIKVGVQRAAINKYEKNIVENIKRSTQLKLAEALQIDPVLIFYNRENSRPNRIKVLGSVPAGVPLEAIEDIVDWEDIPMEWLSNGQEYIGLRVKGDSMYPKYLDGDNIIVKLQPDCECGQDAVVYVNGYDATLKKVIKQPDGIMLQPLNANYVPQNYPFVEGTCDVKVLGVVVEIRRKV